MKVAAMAQKRAIPCNVTELRHPSRMAIEEKMKMKPIQALGESPRYQVGKMYFEIGHVRFCELRGGNCDLAAGVACGLEHTAGYLLSENREESASRVQHFLLSPAFLS
jgi:hypothetical protein